MVRLILLNDNGELREGLAAFLSAQGLDVIQVSCIQEFRQVFNQIGCQIAIIDRMLSDGAGMDLVSEVRNSGERCGIVLFTGEDAGYERISGYTLGVDHCVTKPVQFEELGAIIKSLNWRLQVAPKWELNVVNWTLKTPEGDTHKLTALEAAFLKVLATAEPDKIVSRREIVEALGKNFSAYDPRNLDALVKRLRQKTESTGNTVVPIKTVHGMGYLLSVPFYRVGSSV